jgi:hypothetical protein
MANILFTREFCKRYSVPALTLHPGCVYTAIWIVPKIANSIVNDYIRKVFDVLAYWIMRTPEEGTADILMLCTTKDVEKYKGKYLIGLKAQNTTAFAESEEAAKKLWENSEAVVQKFCQ